MTFGIIFLIMVAAGLQLFPHDYAWVALLLLAFSGAIDFLATKRR